MIPLSRRRKWSITKFFRRGTLADELAPRDDGTKDEFGFPNFWRRRAPMPVPIDGAGWAAFESWCVVKKRRPFPTSPAVVLEFLRDADSDPDLRYAAWTAIDLRHDSIYWHVDANPVLWLAAKGVDVTPRGDILVPDGVVAAAEAWSKVRPPTDPVI